MEYTFRYNAREEAAAIMLDDFGLTYVKGNQKESFPYANISKILISRTDHVFKAFIYPESHRPLIISSQSYSADGTRIDQSKAYSLFIRVLHHHLKEKSKAEFKSGNKTHGLWMRAGLSALISSGLSLAVSYLGVKLINPLVQSLLVAVAVFGFIFIWYAGKQPKSYKPTDIPLRFLP